MSTINLEWDPNAQAAPQSFRDAVQAAANVLDAAIHDPITVNVAVGYGEYDDGGPKFTQLTQFSLGGVNAEVLISYSLLRAALANDETSSTDVQAINALPDTAALEGQTDFFIASAQAKALGAMPANSTAIDGYAGFPTSFTGTGLTDAAIVELVHAMGLLSGGNGALSLLQFTSPGNRLLTSNVATAPSAYFSVDGGNTNLANYDVGFDETLFTNVNHDPLSIPNNEVTALSPLDLTELSAIGFDDTSTPSLPAPDITPTPSGVPAEVNARNVTVAENVAIPALSLIASVSAPVGDAIPEYAFFDQGTGNGHFALGSVIEPDNQWIYALSTQLDALQYVGGSSAGQEPLDVDAYDFTTGTYTQSSQLTATTFVPTPVSIRGTVARQATSDIVSVSPFSGVVIADPNPAQTDTVTTTLSNSANGSLTNLGGGSYNAASGLYTVSGTAVSVTTALEGLVFNPTPFQGAPGQTVTTTFTINVTDTAGLSTTDGTTSIVTTETNVPGLIGTLNVSQQLELIYIAYFNRAADGGGYNFWETQNVQAQNAGENAATSLTNIANAFAPQPETIALYPFLGTANLNLNTQAAQAGLDAFINGFYQNMFDRPADLAGETYWAGQVTDGAIAPGAAALAIANGATGFDSIEAQNKVTVALDFTSKTAAANLGQNASFLMEAKAVLSGVDGSSLNDASVTAGEKATTTYISGSTTGDALIATITSSDQAIQFMADDTSAPRSGMIQMSGFNPAMDALDFGALFGAPNIAPNATFGHYDTHGGGTVAALLGPGDTVTGLERVPTQTG
jgi:hypothetical protein